ncbi:class F sortase [Sphaerisporangium viridialbum]|uniref:class F sortase n=1 Tax=Sphaerisporangium viridialbum TaxID=46189 RepID=UPI003C78CEBE
MAETISGSYGGGPSYGQAWAYGGVAGQVPVHAPGAWVVAPAHVPRSRDLLGWPMRIVLVLAMVIALVVVFIGLFTSAFEARAEAGVSAEVRAEVGTPAAVRPVRVVIPGIGVDAPVRPVGLEASGEIEVPPISARDLAGWYRYGPVPGETGPAVIVGHFKTRSGPAVFARARELRRGDRIEVVRSDGRVAAFTVDGLQQVRKAEFPTEKVYGNIGHPGLRLITCAGVFDRKARAYPDNLIVYASLTSARPS